MNTQHTHKQAVAVFDTGDFDRIEICLCGHARVITPTSAGDWYDPHAVATVVPVPMPRFAAAELSRHLDRIEPRLVAQFGVHPVMQISLALAVQPRGWETRGELFVELAGVPVLAEAGNDLVASWQPVRDPRDQHYRDMIVEVVESVRKLREVLTDNA